MQDCPEEPTHGYDGEAATFCQAHMAVGMKVSCVQIDVGYDPVEAFLDRNSVPAIPKPPPPMRPTSVLRGASRTGPNPLRAVLGRTFLPPLLSLQLASGNGV